MFVLQFNGTGSVPVTVKEQTALQAAIANTTPALINSKVGRWNKHTPVRWSCTAFGCSWLCLHDSA